MSLTPGTRLGIYEVTAKIGEGGMGEVYQARDTTLDRDVALKVLPEAFTTDPDRLARFQREAKVLASLNHPNIGAIYGLEAAGDTQALVLELIEGPTLADRIAEGPIPVDEALTIAKQIAEALEAAHERGIIHRDLKPANVKVRPDGTVKVLDFGLAKAATPEADGTSGSESPTMSLTAATQMGMVIGTAAYMAPEQARGKPVDKRADVWAFGAVLFEMLAGAKPFAGGDVSEVLATVIKTDPDWDALPGETPSRVRTLLRRCLEKDPKQRVHDVADVRLAMEGAFETAVSISSEQAVAPRRVWQRPVAIAASLAVGLAIGGLAVWALTGPAPARMVRLPMPLADDLNFSNAGRPIVAIAPTGDRVAFTAGGGLWLRPLDQMDATFVSGSDGARNPFFSADGQRLGFDAGGQLKRVPVSGGAPVTLAAVDPIFGASWGADDTILFGQPDGIWRVLGTGGTPELVISVEEGEAVHGPQMLRGGDLVLFTLRPAGTTSWDASQIVVQSLASGERTVLIDGGRDARYVPTGHLVYALNGTLLAWAFDLDQRVLRGGPVALVEGVRFTTVTGAAMFSVSDDGALVYVPGGTDGAERSLVWVDRQGREEFLDVEARPYTRPRLSPDGTRVAVEIVGDDGTSSIWVADATRGTLGRVTAGEGSSPVWTSDGQQVVFASLGDGEPGLFRQSADGTGEVERLVNIEATRSPRTGNWSPDGSRLVFDVQLPGNASTDFGVLTMEGERVWTPLLDTEEREIVPVISPDGQWIAYASTGPGQDGLEVYVQRFPELGQRQPISTDGGMDPTWSADGRELFYLGSRGGGAPKEMAVVTIEPGPPLSVGAPEVLFDIAPYARRQGQGRQYDVDPDGQRFLMLSVGPPSDRRAVLEPQINLVLNWFEELQARVPLN